MRTRARYLLIWIILYLPATMVANDDLPEPQMSSGPGIPPPPGLVVPIDTGESLLLLAGLMLGGYFIMKFRRKAY